MFYTDFWGLSFPPFANDSRAETFVPTRGAALVIARLRYALGQGLGASALFGMPGVGKTRIARMVLEEFAAARWHVAYLPNPFGNARDILTALSPAAGAAIPANSGAITELESFLLARARSRQPVLLAVDDVQTTRGTDFLETLRTLLNVEHAGIKALSLLLVGQAGMERKLAAASRFDSQLLMRAVLDPMTDEETRLYILARLKAAGSRQGIFTRHAAEKVVEYSKGLPRQVNRLCEMSLVVAFGLEENRVSPDIVEMAAADLDMLPAGEATFFPWPHPEADEEEPDDGNSPEEEDILAALPSETGDNA